MSSRSKLVGWTLGCLAVAACSSPTESPEATGVGFSVVGALTDLPASSVDGQDPIQIVTANLVQIGETEGLTRPTDAADADAIREWIGPLTGTGRYQEPAGVYVPLPELFAQQFLDTAAFDDELGFDITDVRGFVEVSQPPRRLTVLALDEGEAPSPADGQGDVIDIGDGEDYERSPDEATSVRPLGRPLRLGVRDDFVAVGLDTDAVRDWLTDEPDPLADIAELGDVAVGLDDAGVVSAVLARDDFTVAAPAGALSSPEVTAELLGDIEGIEPFHAVGIGWTETDAQAVVVYRFADEDAAAASVEGLKASYDANSAVIGGPIPDLLDVIDLEADGQTVTATVQFTADTAPLTLYRMLLQRDVPFMHP